MGVVLVATDRDRWLDLGLLAGTDVGLAEIVITSYSIHYTKLYERNQAWKSTCLGARSSDAPARVVNPDTDSNRQLVNPPNCPLKS